jgi:hypothetical protein
MLKCTKCGEDLQGDSKFCSKCGSEVFVICPKCSNEVHAGAAFCDKCGAKIESASKSRKNSEKKPAPPVASVNPPVLPPPLVRLLRISREQQFVCMGNTYQVVVNGNVLGSIAVGNTITINVPGDTAILDIISTTPMINTKLRLVLRLSDNTNVVIRIDWPGEIYAAVYGAQILEQTRYF